MCRAIMMRGSVHSTIQPSLSLTLPTSGLRKWLGIRLQITGVSIWTSSLGGHWGTAFIRSLRNIAAEMGMMFWYKRGRQWDLKKGVMGGIVYHWKQDNQANTNNKSMTLIPLSYSDTLQFQRVFNPCTYSGRTKRLLRYKPYEQCWSLFCADLVGGNFMSSNTLMSEMQFSIE